MKGFIIYEDFITNVKSIVNCGRLSPSCYTIEDQKKTGRKIVNWEDVR